MKKKSFRAERLLFSKERFFCLLHAKTSSCKFIYTLGFA